DGVQVACVTLKTQPLRLQRQRTAARERVVERRQLVPVEQLLRKRVIRVVRACPPPALPDLIARRLQHRLVRGVLPQYEVPNDREQPRALDSRGDVLERRLRARRRRV